jgi:tetratricopeptide (TPR) repeat protein
MNWLIKAYERFIGVLGIVTTIAGAIALLRTNSTEAALILLGVGIVALMGYCWDVNSRKDEKFVRGQPVVTPHFSESRRRLAKRGLVIVPVLAVAGLTAWRIYESTPFRPPPAGIVRVLLTEIPDLPNTSSQPRVADQIQLALNELKGHGVPLEVVRVSKSFSPDGGAEAAAKLGEFHKAKLVMWGWLNAVGAETGLYLRVEILGAPHNFPEAGAAQINRPEPEPLTNLKTVQKVGGKYACLTALVGGLIRLDVDDNKGAVALFDEAIAAADAMEPLVADAYYLRGTCRYFLKEWAAAESDYSAAIQRRPTFIQALNARAVVYGAQKKWPEMIEQCKMIQEKLKPTTIPAISINLAVAYAATGRKDEAFKALNDLIDGRGFESGMILTNRGGMYLAGNDLDKAERDFARAIAVEPKYAQAYVGRGRVKRLRGDPQGAIADYQLALKNGADASSTLNFIAYAYLASKQPQQALSAINEAIAKSPADPNYLDSRTDVYRALGQLSSAVEDWKKILTMTKDPELTNKAEKGLAEAGVSVPATMAAPTQPATPASTRSADGSPAK